VTFVEAKFPSLFKSIGYQRFSKIVKSDWFEYGIDFVLVLNAVVIGIQSFPELSGQNVVLDKKYWDGSIDTVWVRSLSTHFVLTFVKPCHSHLLKWFIRFIDGTQKHKGISGSYLYGDLLFGSCCENLSFGQKGIHGKCEKCF